MPATASSSAPPVVQARDLCRRFGRRWAVARVDLNVAPGERLLVVGANGCGKSTLLNMLATLLPVTRGSLRLFGLDPNVHRLAVRRRIGIVRHAHGLYEDLSARDNLNMRARLVHKTVDPEKTLARVGLDAARTRSLHTAPACASACNWRSFSSKRRRWRSWTNPSPRWIRQGALMCRRWSRNFQGRSSWSATRSSERPCSATGRS
ncbi:MAG: ATP-binding cassette domain-containing protein [Oligoflexia bacterium]|nr:ATP-binding cassette domain-containing protein [Oligoflexia bacterium]